MTSEWRLRAAPAEVRKWRRRRRKEPQPSVYGLLAGQALAEILKLPSRRDHDSQADYDRLCQIQREIEERENRQVGLG